MGFFSRRSSKEAPAVGGARRQAVSAEAATASDHENMVKKVVDKPDEDIQKIRRRLAEVFLFSHLDKEAINAIVDAVEIKTFKDGETLMKQGDDGDYFYVVEEGRADIFIEGKGKVATCDPGKSFGELALMYNAPRAATVTAASDLKCYAVDRDTFKGTVIQSNIKKRDRYEAFLDKVPILDTLYKKEKLLIADALIPVDFTKNDVVMSQGDVGDKFYIIEDGSVTFLKDDHEVGTTDGGGYFGEIALLNNSKRAVTVKCKSDCKLLSLDRDTFVRLMGSLDEVLKRNMAKYAEFDATDYEHAQSVNTK